ncbi:MAG TPA: hypothetical protein VMT86_01395 [Bryobacteraceae bacterium]|nr:hypothetical protein [Bryobacteraceae bacterium]
MRISLLLLLALAALLISCGSEPKPAPEPAKPAVVKPADETRRFPSANLVNTEVVNTQLLGKSFMPGGTLAHYKHGKHEYTMFIVKMPTAQDAAFLLLDWNKTLKGSQIVPAFGGYCGDDAGRPVFVFAKDRWVAGVAGLPQKEADLAARSLAAHLD